MLLKKIAIIITCLGIYLSTYSQNIAVNSTQYTAQELVENILINSGCIENILVTNTVSGSFGGNEKSFGYFEANGSNFPFSNGIVMSTGKLSNVPGPNTSLSDDDAPGWGSDTDLEQVLNIGNTTNATIIEFDFTPHADNIRFRYLFASEEYQEDDPDTCIYSDVFAFLIKPIGGQYQNIAVVPDTNTPVQVTTVHPGISGACPPENEMYFGTFNEANAPINFNGQTKALTAQTQVTPNTTYHIKLVIADETNYRYDSAVFLEGNSFTIGVDLGEDKTGENALCEGETYTLEVNEDESTPLSYRWYSIEENANETLLTSGENQSSYTVEEAGIYKVKLDYGNDCTAEDTIEISYADFSDLPNPTIYECSPEGNGISLYNLTQVSGNLTNNIPSLQVSGFFLNESDAENNTNPINEPENFQNTEENQVVYARIVNTNGCYSVQNITLSSANNYSPIQFAACVNALDFSLTLNTNDIIPLIESEIEQSAQAITFYATEEDLLSSTHPIENSITINANVASPKIYAKLESNSGCLGVVPIEIYPLAPPEIDKNYTPDAFCSDTSEVTLQAGIIENEESAYTYQWNTGQTTPEITVEKPGEYEVTVTNTHSFQEETYTCTTTNLITVKSSEVAKVSHQLIGKLGNQILQINAVGSGAYMYALDTENTFQESNTFENLTPGKHRFFVTDVNGCGTVSKTFYVVDYMRFFTPNNDGINDVWHLKGTNRNDYSIEQIHIFDRFGKRLSSFSAYGSWNGTANGKPLPSNDYWFLVEFADGSTFKSHFTLKR